VAWRGNTVGVEPSPDDPATDEAGTEPPVAAPDPPAPHGALRAADESVRPGEGAHRHPFRDAGETIAGAATEAELLTGRHEETEAEARAGVVRRLLRAFGGFAVIGVGIALLPLPGPGWVIIIVGLAMLPFTWAERTIVQIRRRIPGIPEEGSVPLSTWIIMGLMVAVFTTVSILFGQQVGNWVGDLWNDLWN
jgi:hypothetical protein